MRPQISSAKHGPLAGLVASAKTFASGRHADIYSTKLQLDKANGSLSLPITIDTREPKLGMEQITCEDGVSVDKRDKIAKSRVNASNTSELFTLQNRAAGGDL